MRCIELLPGRTYYGIRDMISNKKILKSKNLAIYRNTESFLLKNKLYMKKGYVIIRLPSSLTSQSQVKKNIIMFFKQKRIAIGSIDYDMKYIDDINDILRIKPDRLIFVYIKDKMRKGKTLIKNNVLVMYDRESIYPSTTIQGLVGRATGYGANRDLIVYTNVDHVRAHLRWCDSGFDVDYTPDSKYIKGGVLVDVYFGGLVEDVDDVEDVENEEYDFYSAEE